MGLVQVATTTVTSAVSSVILTGIDTDDVYMVTVENWIPVTSTVVTRMRITKSGSADVNADYDFSGKFMKANTSFSNQSTTNNTDFEFSFTGNTAGQSTNAILYLYDFNSSSEFSYGTYETCHNDHSDNTQGLYGGFMHTVASASDGIEFRFHSGNIASGTFTMYKVI
tara:strand:- start:666 stop:1169 length:504 start_codon:yes stop_codon:yes gene_type:complete